MKAMVIHEPGPAENFRLEKIERPALRPGHVIVEVKATSVNPIDTKVRGKQLLFSPFFNVI